MAKGRSRTSQILIGLAAVVILFLVVPILAVTLLGTSEEPRVLDVPQDASATPAEAPGSGAPAPAPPDGTWITFTAPDGRATIELPTDPVLEAGTEVMDGQTMQSNLWLAETRSFGVGLGTLELPSPPTPAMAEVILQGSSDGSVSGAQGTVVSTEPTTLLGHPARRVHFTVPQGDAWATYAVTPDRLVFVLAIGEGDQRANHDRAIASLQLS